MDIWALQVSEEDDDASAIMDTERVLMSMGDDAPSRVSNAGLYPTLIYNAPSGLDLQ